MVQVLALMSLLEIMPTVTATQERVWAITTLFHLQCRTGTQSWPGLSTSHLMRWRYCILTHPPKCKITQTIIFITIKSESEAMGSLITQFKLLINCCFIDFFLGGGLFSFFRIPKYSIV